MNPDIEDPDNHVPEVSPDDDWDDLDTASAKGLPPRRTENLPPKKDAKRSNVKLHAPSLNAGDDGESEGDSEEADPVPLKKPAKAAKKPAGKAAKKVARKSAGKAAEKPVPESVEPVDAGPEEEPVIEAIKDSEETASIEEGEEKIVLPAAQTGKRHRVHEIGIGETSHTNHVQIVSKMTPRVSKAAGRITDESEGEVAMRRRRFVRGERGDWGEGQGQGSNKWMVYTGAGILILVILAVILSQTLGRKPPVDSGKSQFGRLAPASSGEEEVEEDPEMVEMLTNSQDEAKSIYARYAKAGEVKDLSGLLYREEQVMPLVEERWKPLGARQSWEPGDEAIWTVMDKDAIRYGILSGTGDDFTPFSAMFRKDREGLKMDWKATSGYGSATFAEMNKGNGEAGEVRVWISRADFYTFSVPEEKYRSFRLMSPDGEATLWAYTEIGGEEDEKLLKLFVPSEITGESQSEVQVTLSMAPGPDEALPNQWIIGEIVRLSWLDE